jgi:hypothetical protein
VALDHGHGGQGVAARDLRLRQKMACPWAVTQKRGLKESQAPPDVAGRRDRAAGNWGNVGIYPPRRERVFEIQLAGRALGLGPGNIQSPPMTIPKPREEGPSGIRRKVEPQRHAECEVEPDAGCDCNSGHIHFAVPHSLRAESVYARRYPFCRTMQRMEPGLKKWFP